MLDILTAILYNEDMDLLGKKPLETPRTTAEVQFLSHLRQTGHETAALLQKDVVLMLQERHDAAFRSGVCFGTQLAIQLTEDF
nr:hypothetical protein [uncultured Dysosmobacter sp.]